MNALFRKIDIVICVFILHVFSQVVNCNTCPTVAQAEKNDTSTDLNARKIRVITRSEWLAKSPKQLPTPIGTPVPYVVISHTVTQNCCSEAQCAKLVREIQTYHMASKNWTDIGYNFLIGGAGNVFCGRGWARGAHTKDYNAISIGIAFIGNFENDSPTESQIAFCQKLIEQGVDAGYIQKDYKLFGAKQLGTTRSPGIKLFNEIMKWEHWAEKP